MRVLRGLGAWLRDVLLRRSAERGMDEEIRFHIEMETEKNVRAGLSPREARRRALLAFGGVERHRESLRDGRRVPVVEAVWDDVRNGARFVAREPVLSLVAALTVALGVGAVTTVFSTAMALLLRPLPFGGADRVVSVQESRTPDPGNVLEGKPIPYDRVLEYRAATGEVFESVAAHRREESISLRLGDGTVSVNGALTSGNYFRTLGVQPAIGRAYDSDDAAEIVISNDLWRVAFGGDPAVVGRTAHFDGAPVTIVGVAPRGFGGATVIADRVWAPVGVRGVDRGSIWMVPLGRLRPDVTTARATAVVDALSRSIPALPGTEVRSAWLDPVGAVPLQFRGRVAGFLALLLGMAIVVLLIASANIAGVMLARGHGRTRELAVRVAMGADRHRVVGHLLAESLVLFAFGGAAGVVLAYGGTAVLAHVRLPPQVPSLFLDLAPDVRVLGFAALVTGLTGLIFGLVPAVRVSRPDLVPALKAGAPGSIGTDGRLRNVFVGGQVALAVTLLLTAALFARSFRKGLEMDPGLDTHDVAVARINLGPPLDYDEAHGRAFFAKLVDRARALPGVTDVALSEYVLLAGSRSGGRVRRPGDPEDRSVFIAHSTVSPDYFETMRIPVVDGRAFRDTDRAGAPPAVMINRTLADSLFRGESPVGKLLAGIAAEPVEIVGVTGAGRYQSLTEEPLPFVFLPFGQVYRASMAIHVRAPGQVAATLRALADEAGMLDPDVALGNAAPLDDLAGFSLFPQRFAARLVGVFGAVGLLLAALGIYGVLAYQVVRRTREFGVRRALGATKTRMVGSVVARGAVIAALGCAAGVAIGAGVAVTVRSFLFGISPIDPATFAVVPALLFGVALLASWLPALRASAVQPTEALRTD